MAPSIRGLAALLRGAGKPQPRGVRLAYVIPVSDEARNYMRRVEVEVLGRYGPDPALDEDAHITLKQGFIAPALEPFVRHLDEVAAEVEPFEVVMSGIGAFERGILFVDVRPDPPLEALRQRVVRDLSARFGVEPYALEGAGYRFHATLAYGLSDADAARARRTLEAEPVEFRFPLTLGLLYHTGARWIMYRTVSVGRAAARSRLQAGSASGTLPEAGR